MKRDFQCYNEESIYFQAEINDGSRTFPNTSHHSSTLRSTKKKKIMNIDHHHHSEHQQPYISVVQNQNNIFVSNQTIQQQLLYSLQGQYVALVNEGRVIENDSVRTALSIIPSFEQDNSSSSSRNLFNFEMVEWSRENGEGRSKLDVLSGIIHINGDNTTIGMVFQKKALFKSLHSGPEQYWKCEEVSISEFQPVFISWRDNNLELKVVVKGFELTFSKR